MKRLYVENPVISSSGKSIWFTCDNKNWTAILEVWAFHDIHSPKDLEGAVIEIDTSKDIYKGKLGYYHLSRINIISVSKHDNNFIVEKIHDNVEEDKNSDVFDENIIVEEFDITNDLSNIYKGIEFYTIKEDNSKMDPLDKIIEKAVKITKTKYNYGSEKNDDFAFSQMFDLAKNDLIPFIKGDTTSLIIERPKNITIPASLKDDKTSIIEYLEKKYLGYTTKSDFKDFERGYISVTKLVEKIVDRRNAKFVSLKKLAQKAEKIKHEIGFNPLSIAWPWVIGKTEKGTFFHVPICYQYIKIEETLDAYRITKEPHFHLNTYPILKNYTENKAIVETIEVMHSSLKDVLIEFYKHGIKIMSPRDFEMKNYSRVQDIDELANRYSDGVFELSQEVLFTIKAKDEPIYIDLKKIRNKFEKFSIPESNKSIKYENEFKESNEKHFILDLDDSKSFAVDEAIKDSVVIKGPPGTGKSETITAIIGEIIKNFKTSLLVAEKSTAIEVIEKNMRKIELDTFVVNLNDDSKNKFTTKFKDQISLLLSKKYTDYRPSNIRSIRPSIEWINSNTKTINLFEKISNFNDSLELGSIFNSYSEWALLHKFLFGEKTINFENVINWVEKAKVNNSLKTSVDSFKKQKVEIAINISNIESQRKSLFDSIDEILLKKSLLIKEKEAEILNLQSVFEKAKATTISSIKKLKITELIISDNIWKLILDAKEYEDYVNILQYKRPLFLKSFIKNNLQELKMIEEFVLEFKEVSSKNINEEDKINQLITKLNEEIKWLKTITKNNIKSSNSDDLEIISLEKTLLSLDKEEKEYAHRLLNINKEIAKYNEETSRKYNEVILSIPKSTPNKELIKLFEEIQKLETDLLTRPTDWDEHIGFVKNHISNVREWIIHKYAYEFNKLYENDQYFSKNIEKLNKAIDVKLQKRSNTIIDLFEQYHYELKKVFPCIMASPDIISAILPIDKEQFDYGIFDEASQIRLHKAIPTIHRCKQIIVSGDEKQLGPTDLFTNISNDEDIKINRESSDEDELSHETLLDFATDRYKKVLLNTHYRSKSKQLIEFSNKHFYDDKINITDSPESKFDGRDGIIVEEIAGNWTENNTNEEEAQRAVILAKEYLEKGLSLGVITFNDSQASLILKGIESVVDSEYLGLDNFFVKPIKEVQGDERDVIIFSITYGQRVLSKTYVKQFGQFSKEKINVAITRSRKRLHVLKSLPASEVDAKDDDKRIFKEWLIYLENISTNTIDIDNYNGKPESVFEEDYLISLKKFIPDNWVPLSNYPVGMKRIDIVIFDKIRKKFIIAIELDGVKYHSGTEKQIEDYNRQVFLENMGWKFIRVVPLQFYSNRYKHIMEVIEKIKDISM